MPALRSPGLQTFRDANSPVGGLSLTCQAGEETMPLKKGKWELIVWWDEPIPPLEKVTLPRAPQCVPGLHVSFTDNVLSSPQWTHNTTLPHMTPILPKRRRSHQGGEKLYVPPAVKREEITETFLTLRGGGANMWIGAVNSHQSTSY